MTWNTFGTRSKKSVLAAMLAAMLVLWIAPSITSAQAPTAADSLRAAIEYGRHLEDRISVLSGEIRTARRDSVMNAEIYALNMSDRDRQIAALENALPRWYEKPAFVAGAVAVVTIYAVLKAVHISVE